jgi:hypothetical protein
MHSSRASILTLSLFTPTFPPPAPSPAGEEGSPYSTIAYVFSSRHHSEPRLLPRPPLHAVDRRTSWLRADPLLLRCPCSSPLLDSPDPAWGGPKEGTTQGRELAPGTARPVRSSVVRGAAPPAPRRCRTTQPCGLHHEERSARSIRRRWPSLGMHRPFPGGRSSRFPPPPPRAPQLPHPVASDASAPNGVGEEERKMGEKEWTCRPLGKVGKKG